MHELRLRDRASLSHNPLLVLSHVHCELVRYTTTYHLSLIIEVLIDICDFIGNMVDEHQHRSLIFHINHVNTILLAGSITQNLLLLLQHIERLLL